MADKNLTSIRDGLRRILTQVRAESDSLTKKRTTLDPRWSDEAKRNAVMGWRAEIATKIDSLTASVTDLTREGLAAQDRWTTREYLKRHPLTKSTGSDTTQAAILEELSQMRMAQALPRLTTEELGRRTDDAIAGQKWGELGIILTEVEDRKRAQPDAHEWPLLAATIERLSPPEVEAAREMIQEIRYCSQWIVSARQSVLTGAEDYGRAMEASLLAQAERDAGQYDEAKARMQPFMEASKSAA